LLKSEGWQFIQLSGQFTRYKNHESAYEKFTARVEDIIQLDVHTYINDIVGERNADPEAGEVGEDSSS